MLRKTETKFYQKIRWLQLKELLDAPTYTNEIKEILISSKAKNILDMGTGIGSLFKFLSTVLVFESAIGIDVQADLIEYANLNNSDPKIKFQIGDTYQIPVADEFFDLVTAQALLEHVDSLACLQELQRVLKKAGYAFFLNNYDGVTNFEPVIDYDLDQTIVENFNHYSIEGQHIAGRIGGDSKCGRKLWHLCKQIALKPVIFQSSDWVLYPHLMYNSDEQELLKMLIDFFVQANLVDTPKVQRLPENDILYWQKKRYSQIDNNELVYICRQMSVVARKF